MSKMKCVEMNFRSFSGDQRLSGHKKNDHNNFKELTKKEVDVILGYIQLWPQRFVQWLSTRASDFNSISLQAMHVLLSRFEEFRPF